MGADPSIPDVDELEDAPSGKKRRAIILIALAAVVLFVGGYLAYQAYEDYEYEKSLRNIIPLAVEYNGVQTYFYEDEWNAMHAVEKNGYRKLGVLIDKDNQPFILALDCVENGRTMTWNQAMSRYSNVMPTKRQGEVIAAQDEAVRHAIEAFGGSDVGYWFWTNEEFNSSRAWTVYMHSGRVRYFNKNNTISVRPVARVAEAPR